MPRCASSKAESPGRASNVGGAIAALVLCAGVLGAQDTTAARPHPLPPLSVTAARTSTSIYDLPLAVTLVTPEWLRSRRGVGIDEALSLVPGVFAQSRSGGGDVRVIIRGFGARGAGDRSNSGTSRGIRVLLDGIPETEPDGRTALDLVDLALVERAEIVRSNATASYGNAAGGVVDLRTVPEAGARRASAGSQAGSFGLRRAIARWAAPLGDGVLYAGVAATHLDGWRAHAQSDRTTLIAGAAAPLGARTRGALLLAAGNDRFLIPGPLTRAEAETDPRRANATYAARRERRHNRIARFGLTVEHSPDSTRVVSAMLFAAPKALQRSERGTYRDFARYHVGGHLVLRASHAVSPGVRGRLTVGADEAFQDGDIVFRDLTPEGTRGATVRDDRRESANNAGVFFEELLTVGERLLLSAGARYDAIRYDYKDLLEPSLNAVRTFARVTPKIGATWKLAPTHSLYANVGGGVEAPAGNETDPAGTFGQDTVTALNPLLEPIRSTTYEIGTKRAFTFPARVPLLLSAQYDVALYRTEVRNEIVPYRGGRFYFTAGRARRQGAELGLALQAVHGLGLRGALTLNRHRYTEYVVDSVHYGAPGRTASYAGNRVVGVPGAHHGLTLSWSPEGLAGLRLEGGFTGADSYFADDANAVRVPGYRLLNATAAFEVPVVAHGLALRGFLTANNLTGRRYIASAYLNPDVVNGVPVAFEPGTPREIVVGVSVGRF